MSRLDYEILLSLQANTKYTYNKSQSFSILLTSFFMSQSSRTPFQPLAFQVYSESQIQSQFPEVKLQEYHNLQKMKKVLAQTQQKMKNRINLFRKASQKLIKQEELNYKVFTKLQAVREHPSYIRRLQSRNGGRTESASRATQTRIKREAALVDSGALAEQLMQQRLHNARELKQEKSRLRVIIQEQRKMDLERKLTSANGIRKTRQNARQAKEMLEQQRKEAHQRELLERYAREKEQFLAIEKQMGSLQLEQEEALLCWKRTMEEQH